MLLCQLDARFTKSLNSAVPDGNLAGYRISGKSRIKLIIQVSKMYMQNFLPFGQNQLLSKRTTFSCSVKLFFQANDSTLIYCIREESLYNLCFRFSIS